MKLKNKKTGEIGRLQPYGGDGRIWVWIDNISRPEHRYSSLAKLNEEWEDYEKTEEHYFISNCGEVINEKAHSLHRDGRIRIGNDFNSKEEAEKAIEKLKAWKRLKDKGFRFEDFYRLNDCACALRATFDESWSELYDDLLVLFGGEE